MQITLLDEAGQEVYRRSKLTEAPLWSVEAMLNEPEIVTQVHKTSSRRAQKYAHLTPIQRHQRAQGHETQRRPKTDSRLTTQSWSH